MTQDETAKINAKLKEWMDGFIADAGLENRIEEEASAIIEKGKQLNAAVESEDFDTWIRLTGEDPNNKFTKNYWEQQVEIKRMQEAADSDKPKDKSSENPI